MTLDLAPFQGLIRERCGLLFTGDNKQQLAEALATRIAGLSIEPSCYKAQLGKDEHEFQALVNLLTNNETYFFRESQQISFLVECLVPRLLASPDTSEPIRILSAGCSSGEEPYSLAMALMDVYGERAKQLFTVIGADIDTAALDKARRASYTEFSFRGVHADVRARYFDKDGRCYLVKDELKRMVSFVQLNLLENPLIAAPHDLDIVFFRNVSIYFDTAERLAIHKNLAALMREESVLITGLTETMANDLGVFRPREEEGLFYFSKGHLAPSERRQSPRNDEFGTRLRKTGSSKDARATNSKAPVRCDNSLSPANSLPCVVVPVKNCQLQPLETARQSIRGECFDAALMHLDTVLMSSPNNTEALLLKAYVLLDRKNFATAVALAEQVLARDEWSVDALYLLGLATRWQQQTESAIGWFKRAVYACHECWPAHYYLGGLYRDKGSITPAQRAYSVVIHHLSVEAVETGIRYVPVRLPDGEILKLCKRQIAELREATQRAGEH